MPLLEALPCPEIPIFSGFQDYGYLFFPFELPRLGRKDVI
jgi:hypothetical protein